MKARIWISIVICALLIATPFIVQGIENYEISKEASGVPEASTSSSGITYLGTLESHNGADTLIVTPAEAYVPSSGAIVYVNATVHFLHAQPCPHSGWKIVAENEQGVEIIKEGETKLLNSYTAEKTFEVKVIENGSLDIVYYYGPTCPYGTEERVTVRFYISSAPSTVTPTLIQSASNSTREEKEKIISGKLAQVDEATGTIKVGNETFEIRGRWTGPGNTTLNWKSLVTELNSRVGEEIKLYLVEENGTYVLQKIAIDGETYVRGR